MDLTTHSKESGEDALQVSTKNISIKSEHTRQLASDSQTEEDKAMAPPKEAIQHSDLGSTAHDSSAISSHSDQAATSTINGNPIAEIAEIPKESLRTFPAEIRQMIFDLVITAPNVPRDDLSNVDVPEGVKVALIEALRCDGNTTVYREALEIYFKKVTLVVTEANLERVHEMSENTLSLVHNLCINYSLPSQKRRTFTLHPLLEPTDKLLLSTAKTLKTLTLIFKDPITLTEACVALEHELPALVNSFNLESLTIVLPNENERPDMEVPYHGMENQQCVRDLMKKCREAMRVSGRLCIDFNHQVFKIQFVPPQHEGRDLSKERDVRGKGKTKMNEDAGCKEDCEETKPSGGLEWREDRIGDGWKGECTCDSDHDPDAALPSDPQPGDQPILSPEMAVLFGFLGDPDFSMPVFPRAGPAGPNTPYPGGWLDEDSDVEEMEGQSEELPPSAGGSLHPQAENSGEAETEAAPATAPALTPSTNLSNAPTQGPSFTTWGSSSNLAAAHPPSWDPTPDPTAPECVYRNTPWISGPVSQTINPLLSWGEPTTFDEVDGELGGDYGDDYGDDDYDDDGPRDML